VASAAAPYSALVQHFPADRIDLAQLAHRVLDEDLDPLAPVDQGCRFHKRGLDGVDAEVEMPGVLTVAQDSPVAAATVNWMVSGCVAKGLLRPSPSRSAGGQP